MGLKSKRCKNELGNTYGHLTVIGIANKTDGRGSVYWICRCTCGEDYIVRGTNLRSGGSTRCSLCSSNAIAMHRTTHNETKTPLYRVWRSMKHRCNNTQSKQYLSYGGRGITVCNRWEMSFLDFKKDMGDVPDNCSLDRIDNDRGYEPVNCRWATRKMQQQNRRCVVLNPVMVRVIRYLYSNKKKTLACISRATRINYSVVQNAASQLTWGNA